jgi:hypothetical protein
VDRSFAMLRHNRHSNDAAWQAILTGKSLGSAWNDNNNMTKVQGLIILPIYPKE